MKNMIKIIGARTHNLQNVNVDIPKDSFVVVTGVSGSGKSSLILDTLFNYSKKIYLEALSSRNMNIVSGDYDVDYILGTQPPVALEQTKSRFSNPRSTVSTITGIEGYLRVFFARAGHPVCPACFKPTDNEFFCAKCGCFAEELIPQHFHTNLKEGMCLKCNGIGKIVSFSRDKIIPDKSKTLNWIWDNAEPGTFSSPSNKKIFETLCEEEGISMDTPFKDLPNDFKEKVLYGSEKEFTIKIRVVTNVVRHRGIISYMEAQYKTTKSMERRKSFEVYFDDCVCPECKGGKLRKESLAVMINEKNYADLQTATIKDLNLYFDSINLGKEKVKILSDTLNEIKKRLKNICDLSIEYLSLNRVLGTLSSGELQRLLLSQHIASDLTGVIYILDEPTIGLHDRDVSRLLKMLFHLKEMGNSVIIIEHDEQLIQNAEWIIEVGPGAGKYGGKIVTSGVLDDIRNSTKSITFKYLNNRKQIRERENIKEKDYITIKDATKNNLKNVTVQFPLNSLVCITGVSGAGKSSLLEFLYNEALLLKARKKSSSNNLEGFKSIEDIIYIEQKPIGKSSRSNTATYIGLYDYIRDFFANLEESKDKDLNKSYFSINVAGGRCETCKGMGYVEVDMAFLQDEYMKCKDCDGKQFQQNILEIKYNGNNIHEVLNMSVEDAIEYFKGSEQSKITEALDLLMMFGLGYVKLGQQTTTFSGGEAQRINLITELLSKKKVRTLFIFDEPTTGLHFLDIQNLINLFNQLISSGHSILIIEHNLDIIYHADYIIDIGPEGGVNGGEIIFAGLVDDLIKNTKSYTGKSLKKHYSNYYK